jgi:hypothetical protein
MRGRIDRGPCFFCWRLSNRRKVIRDCWLVPTLSLLTLVLLSGLPRIEAGWLGLP